MRAQIVWLQWVNPLGAGTRIFRKSKVNTVAAGVPATYLTGPPTTMILVIWKEKNSVTRRISTTCHRGVEKRKKYKCIWLRSRNCGCLVTWFCYQLIAKPGNKTAAVSWPAPSYLSWSKVSTERFNILRPRPYGRHFPDDIFKCIFLNENLWISNKIPLKYVTQGSIDNKPSLVQIMDSWTDYNPLSEIWWCTLLTYIYVTWPQWVNSENNRQPVMHYLWHVLRWILW